MFFYGLESCEFQYRAEVLLDDLAYFESIVLEDRFRNCSEIEN
jgi:hypothetical protein